MEQDKTSIYVDYLNQKVFPIIDYDRLQASYGTQDKEYAKAVLHLLHQANGTLLWHGLSDRGSNRLCYGS
jgi:hypothetical protein